nr:MAG TPA: hypothetical protein [Caudoviricetes sp.]
MLGFFGKQRFIGQKLRLKFNKVDYRGFFRTFPP